MAIGQVTKPGTKIISGATMSTSSLGRGIPGINYTPGAPSFVKGGGGGGSSSTTGGMSTPSGPVLVTSSGEIVGTAVLPTPVRTQTQQELREKSYYVVSAETPRSKAQQELGELKTKQLRGETLTPTEQAKLFGYGALASVKGTVQGLGYVGKKFLTSAFPASDIKPKLPLSSEEAFLKKERLKEQFKNIGTTLREQPQYISGYATSEAATFYVPTKAGKIVTKIEKAAGLPRYKTSFVSQAAKADTGKVTSDVTAITRREGLLPGERQFYTQAQTTTSYLDSATPSLKGVKPYVSETIGTTKEYAASFPGTGKMARASKPSQFAAAETGLVKEGNVYMPLARRRSGQYIAEMGVNLPGYKSSGIGAVRGARGQPTIYLSRGSGAQPIKDLLISASASSPLKEKKIVSGFLVARTKSYEISKAGRGRSLGVSYLGVPEQVDKGYTILGKPSRDLLLAKKAESAQKAAIEQAIEQQVRQRRDTLAKPFGLVGTPKAITKAKTLQPSQSVYYGTGQYEQTAEQAFFNPFSLQIDYLGMRQKARPAFVSSIVIQRPKEKTFEIPLVTSAVTSGLKDKILPKQIFFPREALKERQKTRIKTPIPREPIRSKTPLKIIPRTSIPKPEEKTKPSLFFGKFKRKQEPYVAEVRRYGKFRPVAKGGFLQVLSMGIRGVRERLGASLRIKKGGQIVQIASPSFFRPAKKEKGVIVQRREARLSSLGERAEIISARGGAKWL